MNITPFFIATYNLKKKCFKMGQQCALRTGPFWQNTFVYKRCRLITIDWKIVLLTTECLGHCFTNNMTILHLMKELCPIPLCWIQNVSQSTIYCTLFCVSLKKLVRTYEKASQHDFKTISWMKCAKVFLSKIEHDIRHFLLSDLKCCHCLRII